MDPNTGSRPEQAPRLTWKGKAIVLAASLAFVLLALAPVAGVIEDPMFLAKARERYDQLGDRIKAGTTEGVESELRAINEEVRREKALMTRYFVLAALVAVANALLAIWRVGRPGGRRRLFLWLGLSGLFWGLTLSNLYDAMHRRILPGGIQDPGLRQGLVIGLFAIAVLNGPVVAWLARRLSRPKPLPVPR